ncbi:MAG TPA: adaptor protein MecA [Hungateiclostridium thermocellum]|jgi:adapter protein MecA 1/2|uniref:Negative regulator of genetic competence n=2 Tax=Acetivibrio thermocellus TaxID=1515 RepID=A3DBJ7_ACET2|nr:adaptor protein MecA [Acetivibrio thermocellus]CDG34768.1 negative regulator of genetic competence [Acetivibrio thermocellus BC1]ABN51326.1 Negative regulator of genetic competence [Acetivibrio thermocellus ATCC 27405]ADU75187.1 Negative regulator of genetic competence [Acetivibrio thermocellus DSM 1313]ALX09162.1 Negative regulator of genetic competence [Acetivibrio thermocellus AD2]ANV76914.1 Negative regulator of genetic competence [Acetivibrio thermocellus DSM 2360]
MKIEKINENKIKVTISIDDLLERNIDLDTLNYNTPAAQELFWDMMEQAEIQFGFDASDSQICVEAIPDPEEGFVIIITKLDEDGEFESIHKYIKNRFRKSDLRVRKRNSRVSSSIVIYFFNNFEDLCSVCQKLRDIYSGESTLYRLKGVYYLVLTKNSWSVANLRSFEPILSEFGTKVSNVSFYEGYLNEHGEKIIEYNAVETINDYFHR